MYRLIICEKPAAAQSIAAALGIRQRREGYLEGKDTLVSWCIGHLAGLADAETYNAAYAKWRISDLPILPENWQFTIDKEKGGQFDTLRILLNREDVAEVVNACDAGREGELIFGTAYHLAGCEKPV
ncbi:MAG: DNA topoisomerase III, partial [Oscillibacter sp.]|nr:DNA topoisomerase III [Oscillibacter sp.]